MQRSMWVLGLLAAVTPARARADEPAQEQPAVRTPFDRGRFGLSLGAGSQTSLGAHYFVVGGGVGYFVLDGLELGVSGLYEFGDGPSISRLSPSIRYLAQPLVGKWPVIPYVGAFYTHWFIGDNYADIDAIGARSGLVYIAGSILLGVGVAYEHTVSACTMDCDSVYPELTISLAL